MIKAGTHLKADVHMTITSNWMNIMYCSRKLVIVYCYLILLFCLTVCLYVSNVKTYVFDVWNVVHQSDFIIIYLAGI